MLNQSGKEIRHYYPASAEMAASSGNELNLLLTDRGGENFYINMAFYSKAVRVRLFKERFEPPVYDVTNREMLTPEKIEIAESDKHIHVYYKDYQVLIGKNPFEFAILTKRGTKIYEENMHDVNSVGEGMDQIPPIGYTKAEDGCIREINLAPKLRMDEHIYGLGERFTEFDKRGQSIRMRNFDTLGCRDYNAYKNIPFYVSTYGYGLFIHDHSIYDFEVGSRSVSSISIRVPGSQMEYFVILGETPKKIISSYMELTGPAVLPPDWSFGLWYSTGFKGNSRNNVEEDARKFKELDIPYNVMHFDCYWLREDMWCDFVWDDIQYPNRAEMIQELKKQGIRICLWINPYITEISDMFAQGKANGYLVKRQDGSVYTADLWHGLLPWCGIVDFTNPDAVKWYQDKVAALLYEGVDMLKTDFAEDIPEDSLFFNGMQGERMRNIYSRLYNDAVFNITKKIKGEDNGIVWARSGCAGMQKYPVCWSGDPPSSYEGMAATLRGGLSLAMSGVPFWSHDMGGFYGNVSEEILIRWSQFGLFSSHSRLHGTSTKQPWAYGSRVLTIMKKFIDIRYELMPYILETAKRCVKESVPFIRPLIMEHPEDLTARMIWDQYYFGEDMIVCPVFGGDMAKRRLYLPEGNWTDYLTGKVYEGRRWYGIECTLDYIPVFRKNYC